VSYGIVAEELGWEMTVAKPNSTVESSDALVVEYQKLGLRIREEEWMKKIEGKKKVF